MVDSSTVLSHNSKQLAVLSELRMCSKVQMKRLAPLPGILITELRWQDMAATHSRVCMVPSGMVTLKCNSIACELSPLAEPREQD